MFRAIAYASEDAFNNDRDDYVNAVQCETEEEADGLRDEWSSRYGYVRVAEFEDGEEVTDDTGPEPGDDESPERDETPNEAPADEPSDNNTGREV